MVTKTNRDFSTNQTIHETYERSVCVRVCNAQRLTTFWIVYHIVRMDDDEILLSHTHENVKRLKL